MKKAIILHAWYSKPEDDWYPWLKEKLEEKGYEVCLPKIPTMKDDYPNMNKQLTFIENLLKIDKETVIIGHSLGCLLAMRLAEKYVLKKMILIAGWDFDDLTTNHKSFWQNKLNHDLIKKNVKEIYCVTSDNDPYITLFQVREMSKRLEAKCIVIKKGGHFATTEKTKQIIQLLPLI
jgi:predicted alpha/beta hydrolase family esterase